MEMVEQIAPATVVGGSYHMEKEGISRAIQYLHDKGLTIQVLVTDRHTNG